MSSARSLACLAFPPTQLLRCRSHVSTEAKLCTHPPILEDVAGLSLQAALS